MFRWAKCDFHAIAHCSNTAKISFDLNGFAEIQSEIIEELSR